MHHQYKQQQCLKENHIKAIITLLSDFQGFLSIYFSCVLQRVYTHICIHMKYFERLAFTYSWVCFSGRTTLRRGILLLASNS